MSSFASDTARISRNFSARDVSANGTKFNLRAPPKITQLKNKLSIIREIFGITHIFHGQIRFLMQKM